MLIERLRILVFGFFVLILLTGCQSDKARLVTEASPALQTQPLPEITLETTEPSPVETQAPGGQERQTRIRTLDGMVQAFVPAGSFQMGSSEASIDEALTLCNTFFDSCERSWYEGEAPLHIVSIDAFWIDQTEISNAQYRLCVETGVCRPPSSKSSDTHPDYFDNPSFDDYPVVNVNWQQADEYCQWAGAALPNEAQWEYAARGPDNKIYPWGNEYRGDWLNACDVNCTYSWAEGEFDDGYADTAPVGSYPQGASWCGVLNLAGNVMEWMADWYAEFTAEPQTNPAGPAGGTTRTIKGNAAEGTRSNSRMATRHGMLPHRSYPYTGFRCVSP